MYYEREINLLASKSKVLKEFENKVAIIRLKKMANDYLIHSSKNETYHLKNLKTNDTRFPIKKSENYIKNEEKIFSLMKNEIIFNVRLNKFWQKQITVSNYNHIDTSYIKYEVYIQIDNKKISKNKYMLKFFLNEKYAENYFRFLKRKIMDVKTKPLLNEIMSKIDKKIFSYKKMI